MKKIYLLFVSLLGLFGQVNLYAQDDYEADFDNPLITEVEQFSSPYSDEGEGNFYSLLDRLDECPEDQHPNNDFWHSDWHHGNQTPGTHYFQVEFADPESLPEKVVFWFKRRPTDNDHTTEWSVRGTNDPDAAKDDCEELAYVLTPFHNNTEELTSTPFAPSGYKYLRFYSEAQEGSNANNFNRGYFHLSRFNIYPLKSVPENEVAQAMLSEAYDKYIGLVGTLEPGVEPGQYDEAAVMAFEEAVDGLDPDNLSDDEYNNLTKDKAQEMIDAVEALYQAALATKVTFGLASGYYHIRAGMEYTNNVVIGHDDEADEDITEEQVRDKYMMSHRQDGKFWGYWGTPEDFKEATQKIRPLFKVTNMGDGTYDIVGCMYNTRFNNVARSTNVEMSADSENLMAIDAAGTFDDITYVNIRVSTQNGADGLYLHQGGHSNGAGKNGFLVGWYNTFSDGPAASEWYFEKVEDSEAETIIAAWQPELEKEQAIEDYHNLYDQAAQEIEAAKDVTAIALVTDASQFSSPFSQNDLGGADGGNLSDGVLIDNDASTYWHSVWSGESIPEGRHYLQVELPEDFDASHEIYMQFTRRKTDNNHITEWTIRGTNEGEYTEEEECEELLIAETPYGNNTETLKTATFDTKGYKFIRLYCSNTTSGSSFFHMSELNLYYDKENPNSQYSMIGQPAVDLEAVLAEQKDLKDEDITQEVIDKLNNAYDAFKAEFVDPAELRQVIASVENKPAIVTVGKAPGFWPDNSTATALTATITAAKAYDEAGHYAKATSAKYIEDLQAQAKAIDDAVIKVQTGKWYRLRFGTEEEYEANEWPTAGDEADLDDSENVRNEALFGKYITLADSDSDGDGHNTVFPIDLDEVDAPWNLYADADEDIENKDMSMFRFISVGDTAYVIQNKASGLYIDKGGMLGIQPALFTQHIAGNGQNAFFIRNLQGVESAPLHTARSWNVLCAWGYRDGDTWAGWGNTDGRRGCFYIEPVEDVAADYAMADFKMAVKPGSISARCYPVSIKGNDGMYGLNDVTETADGGYSLTIVPIKEAAAGRPFFLALDGEYDAEADDYELLEFSHGTDIVAEPVNGKQMIGTFYGATIGDGVIQLSNNKFSVTKSANASVGEFTAYIIKGEDKFENIMAAVTYTIDAEGVDGIQQALQNVVRTGDIYTIDGRFVGRGNLRSISQKGIYVINGTKVVVK